MIRRRVPRPGPGLRAAIALAALLAAAALLLSPGLRALLVPLAFLAGAALERYRHDLPRHPPSLRGTPAAWATLVRDSVGWPAALLAGAILAAAAALLLLGSESRAPRPRVSSIRAPARTAPLPKLSVRRERIDREFRAHGAAFRVMVTSGARWAREIRQRHPGAGRRWVTIGVKARNLTRATFDPTRLAYRLRDAHGQSYIGDFRGGTGPRSLAQRGSLRHGQTALVQLGFRVPTSARRLTLVFEDQTIGNTQTQVTLRTVRR